MHTAVIIWTDNSRVLKMHRCSQCTHQIQYTCARRISALALELIAVQRPAMYYHYRCSVEFTPSACSRRALCPALRLR